MSAYEACKTYNRDDVGFEPETGAKIRSLSDNGLDAKKIGARIYSPP